MGMVNNDVGLSSTQLFYIVQLTRSNLIYHLKYFPLNYENHLRNMAKNIILSSQVVFSFKL